MLATSLSWLILRSYTALVLHAAEGNCRCILVNLEKLELPYLRLFFVFFHFPFVLRTQFTFKLPLVCWKWIDISRAGNSEKRNLSGTQSVALGLVLTEPRNYDRMPHCARSLHMHTSDIYHLEILELCSKLV